MRRLVVIAAVALAGCGGGGSSESAEDVVKAWATALDDRDWQRACELMVSAKPSCEDDLREEYADERVTYEGPASNGNPDDRVFSLHAGRRTLMVAAVARDGGFAVRFDAVIERAGR